MVNTTALINKLAKVFNSLNVSDRSVYKRKTTRTGGDPVIGVGATVSSIDTKLSPLPVVIRPRPEDPLVISGVNVVPATDYLLYISPKSFSASEFKDKDMAIVFKSGSEEEVCSIEAVDPAVLQGTVINYVVLARSKKR
jgi:hypothetical protein